MRVRVRKLAPSDDRSRFSCGDPDLDSFFRQFAAKNQFEYLVGVTYVAVDDRDVILGFVTVAAGSLSHKLVRKAVGRGAPAYPLPILRVARLGVATGIQKAGVGSELIEAAFDVAITMASGSGCSAVIVDAYPTAISFYERFGFQVIPEEEIANGESNARPRQTMMFLPVRELLELDEP